MRWLLIHTLLIAFLWFTVAPIDHARGAAPGAQQPESADATNADKNADGDLPPAPPLDEEAMPEAVEPLPERDAPAGAKSGKDSAAAGESKNAKADKKKSDDTSGETEDGSKSLPPAPTDEEEAAPPPPGGTLLDKIKKASTPVERPQPTAFHGLRVGKSTEKDVEKVLGKPLSAAAQKDIVRRTYRLDGGERVEIRALQNVVQAIVVTYEPHPRWSELAKEIGMQSIVPAQVVDEFGETAGLALPEAGVLIVFGKGNSDRVAEVVYEKVDAQAFTLRAEESMEKDTAACHRDLDTALVVDPQCARAHWLRARLLRNAGQLDAASKASKLAVKLDPRNPRYRLTAGALLAESGQYAKAIEQTQQGLALSAARPELKACSLNQLGDQISAGPERDFKAALPLHMQAIKFAEPLSHDHNPTVRRLAQESLVVAHLSAARNIAWGNWKKKKTMVPSWLNRAEDLATEFVAAHEATAELPLRVCREALTACVGMEGDLDPTPWAEKALAIALPVLEETPDPMRRRQLEWELGTALYDALQVFHTAGDAEQALKYGELAVEHLEAGGEERQLEPVEAYLLGRLYFRMGSVCALHRKDPQQAVAWFERAIPLLERPVPTAALAEMGRHGESFVSMAVSYWAVGSHEESVRLTRNGMKLMENAVNDGTLDQEALRVPLTNLGTMHRFLGDDEQADAFEEMARKPSETRRK